MSSLTRILDKADRELVAEVQKIHVGAQVYRFLRVALFAFATSLPLTIDTRTISWGVLASIGAGAAETAFRQMWPAFPLAKSNSAVVKAVQDQAKELATAAINAHVADYQASVDTQNTITAWLAGAAKTGQPPVPPGPAVASAPAEAAPVATDAPAVGA